MNYNTCTHWHSSDCFSFGFFYYFKLDNNYPIKTSNFERKKNTQNQRATLSTEEVTDFQGNFILLKERNVRIARISVVSFNLTRTIWSTHPYTKTHLLATNEQTCKSFDGLPRTHCKSIQSWAASVLVLLRYSTSSNKSVRYIFALDSHLSLWLPLSLQRVTWPSVR